MVSWHGVVVVVVVVVQPATFGSSSSTTVTDCPYEDVTRRSVLAQLCSAEADTFSSVTAVAMPMPCTREIEETFQRPVRRSSVACAWDGLFSSSCFVPELELNVSSSASHPNLGLESVTTKPWALAVTTSAHGAETDSTRLRLASTADADAAA